jgi:hypothetical protein
MSLMSNGGAMRPLDVITIDACIAELRLVLPDWEGHPATEAAINALKRLRESERAKLNGVLKPEKLRALESA